MVAKTIPRSLDDQISEHLDCLGEDTTKREEDKPELREISGKIGDSTYNMLLTQLKDRVDKRYFHEERIRDYLSTLMIKRTGGKKEDYFKSSISLLEMIKKVGSIPSSGRICEEEIPFNLRRKALFGIPFFLFDSHVHSYNHIKRYLLNSKEPVNIIRADAHDDCTEKGVLDGGSYIYHILEDPKLQSKIKKVITIYGEKDLPEKRIYMGEIEHTIYEMKNLPIIKGPSILDIDLDVHEQPQKETWGGTCSYQTSKSMLEYYNQQQIISSPKLVARTLKNKVEDPRLVLIATERAWRNRLFFWTIEFDFLTELAA